MKRAVVLFLVIVRGFCLEAHATVQERDGLTLNGDAGWIEEGPLGPVIEQRKLKFEAFSTANYRGYTADWRIADGRLYLTDFTGSVRGRMKSLKWLFPKARGAVFTDWFSGTLHLSLGKVRMSKIHGHVTVTDRLVVVELKNGIVQKLTTFKYPGNIAVINERESARWGEKIDIRKIEYQLSAWPMRNSFPGRCRGLELVAFLQRW